MRRTTCRGCGSFALRVLHDFGPQPLAGNFPLVPQSQSPVPRYPLDLSYCDNCTLMQVTFIPPVAEIFHEDYRYASSTIPALTRHFEEYADWLRKHIPAGGKLLEFGCNDGVLLGPLTLRGISCRGVDASRNMVEAARSKGLQVDEGFFNIDYVESNGLRGQFQLITCSNVYAHMDELSQTTRAVWDALAPGGAFCIEVHDGSKIFLDNQFDTVYHEHLSYYTIESLSHHLVLHGFHVEHFERTSMHGGGLRVLARKQEGWGGESSAPVNMAPPFVVVDVSRAISVARHDIKHLSEEYGDLYGYGAAGRSQMFLNFTGTASCFRSVFDDSPLRQGRYIAGTDVPIGAYQGSVRRGCCVILAWNYAQDIARKIKSDFEAVYTVLPVLTRW